ncbi:MAG: hypothetical protein MUP85_06115 [Candidatus Lokiarchaeota archaeon]|nr:hypothetical protein [Candidatus Lokiarchaeota archaeon]
MNPNDIQLKNLNKIFEYERLSRELDNCNNLEEIKEKAKYCIKLYLGTLETFSDMGVVIKNEF